MKIVTSYSVRLGQIPACLKDTLVLYRKAVDWFIGVMDAEWNAYADCVNNQMAVRVSERLCIRTARNEYPKYSLTDSFVKFPSYLRRAAIMEAFGLVSSYRSNLDGSGRVLRGGETAKTGNNYSLCVFPNGKVYNCDLNASYNIGARYYIREILRNQSERTRLALTAKVPSLAKRSTCTLSDLKGLRAALVA